MSDGNIQGDAFLLIKSKQKQENASEQTCQHP